MYAAILKGAPYGNENAKGHGHSKDKGHDKGHDKGYANSLGNKSVDKPMEMPIAMPKAAPKGNKSVSGHEAIKRLIKEGWEVSRVKGSHHIMKKEGMRPVPVPGHHADMGIGLLKAISKQTGVVF